MAHFAQIDENNNVINIIVVADLDTVDENGIEIESIGVNFLKNLFGNETRWVQTSRHARIRKRLADIGGKYDPVKDEFVLKQPFPSWTLDLENEWQAPIPKPDPLKEYFWLEESQEWIEDEGLWKNPPQNI